MASKATLLDCTYELRKKHSGVILSWTGYEREYARKERDFLRVGNLVAGEGFRS